MLIYSLFHFQKHPKVEDTNLKKVREDLQNKVDYLRKQADVSAMILFVVLEFPSRLLIWSLLLLEL